MVAVDLAITVSTLRLSPACHHGWFNARDVGTGLFFELSSEEGLEGAAFAIALQGVVEGVLEAVAEMTVGAAVALDAVVVVAQFSSAFCVLSIWA